MGNCKRSFLDGSCLCHVNVSAPPWPYCGYGKTATATVPAPTAWHSCTTGPSRRRLYKLIMTPLLQFPTPFFILIIIYIVILLNTANYRTLSLANKVDEILCFYSSFWKFRRDSFTTTDDHPSGVYCTRPLQRKMLHSLIFILGNSFIYQSM